MLKFREIQEDSPDIWRVFISGSSSAGKTHFAKQLLQADFFRFERIYYYHPDIQEDFPVDWSSEFDKPVLCQAGLPTHDDLHDIPLYSVLVLDDLYAEACKDKLMSYLFRVLSSKKKLHVIIMTQRYFAEGSCGLNIRNSSNFHVLMNNADERTNLRVADSMNLRKEVNLAIKENQKELYPYLFIGRTNHARVTGLQIYIDIFSRYQKANHKLMLVYLVSESDFKNNFNLLDSHTAVRNENQIERIPNQRNSEHKTTKRDHQSNTPRAKRPSRFQQRKQFTRQVERIIHRYNLKTKL